MNTPCGMMNSSPVAHKIQYIGCWGKATHYYQPSKCSDKTRMNDKNLSELLARDKFLVSKETVVLCQWEIEA